MIKQFIVLAVCSLLIIITLAPLTEAADQDRSGLYQNCYIESSGTIVNRLAIGLFKIGNKALILYLNIGYKEDGVTSIYEYENGTILWHEQGEHNIMLFIFWGNYSYIKYPDESTFLAFNGSTLITWI